MGTPPIAHFHSTCEESDSSVSNPFSFSYELSYDDYDDYKKKEGPLEAETTTENGHYIIYTTYNYESLNNKYETLSIKVQPNMDIEKVLVVFLDNSLLVFNIENLIFFIFAGICVLICVITLIKTNACGSKNKSISNNQIPNSPIQPLTQISQASEQNQPLL